MSDNCNKFYLITIRNYAIKKGNKKYTYVTVPKWTYSPLNIFVGYIKWTSIGSTYITGYRTVISMLRGNCYFQNFFRYYFLEDKRLCQVFCLLGHHSSKSATIQYFSRFNVYSFFLMLTPLQKHSYFLRKYWGKNTNTQIKGWLRVENYLLYNISTRNKH